MYSVSAFPTQEVCALRAHYNPARPENSAPRETRILVGESCLPVSSHILAAWSPRFQELREEEGDLWMGQLGFVGEEAGVRRAVELLHGYQVHLDFSNVKVGEETEDRSGQFTSLDLIIL